MPDLSIDFCGIKSPNPFWLASAPPTNSAYQVARAFDAGWGGAVWKTIGEPIVNVSSRYSALHYANKLLNAIVALDNVFGLVWQSQGKVKAIFLLPFIWKSSNLILIKWSLLPC